MIEVEDKLDDAWKYYVVAAAEYRAFREVMEEEQNSYYFPSIRPSRFESKFDALSLPL